MLKKCFCSFHADVWFIYLIHTSQASSQVADEIPIPIMLSPSKMHGSMLKNVATPSLPTSLVKPKPVKDYAACKKLPISELKDKVRFIIVYIVITCF